MLLLTLTMMPRGASKSPAALSLPFWPAFRGQRLGATDRRRTNIQARSFEIDLSLMEFARLLLDRGSKFVWLD